MSKHLRSILLIVGAVVLVFFVVEKLMQPSENVSRLDYGVFYQKLEANDIRSFHAVGHEASGELADGTKYTVTLPNTDSCLRTRTLQAHQERRVRFRTANE